MSDYYKALQDRIKYLENQEKHHRDILEKLHDAKMDTLLTVCRFLEQKIYQAELERRKDKTAYGIQNLGC